VNGSTASSGSNAEQEVKSTLLKFLAAFENGEIALMEEFFAEDALTFPRVIMSNDIVYEIDASRFKRVAGMDPQMKQVVREWREQHSGPPYVSLQPRDLDIKMFSDSALVTFHIERDKVLSRRTFVMAYRNGCWKIVHVHASNVAGSGR
jgi:hypothetical protein